MRVNLWSCENLGDSKAQLWLCSCPYAAPFWPESYPYSTRMQGDYRRSKEGIR